MLPPQPPPVYLHGPCARTDTTTRIQIDTPEPTSAAHGWARGPSAAATSGLVQGGAGAFGSQAARRFFCAVTRRRRQGAAFLWSTLLSWLLAEHAAHYFLNYTFRRRVCFEPLCSLVCHWWETEDYFSSNTAWLARENNYCEKTFVKWKTVCTSFCEWNVCITRNT